MPAIKEALQVSTSSIGVLLFGIAAGSIVGLLASSHVIARIGARLTIAITVSIGAVGFVVAGVGVTIAANYAVAFTGLVIFGSMFAICDVAMNLQGAVNERVLGRSVMPIFHAFFSFGTVIGAAFGALSEAIGISIVANLVIVAVTFSVGGLFASQFLHSEQTILDGAVAEDDHSKTWRGRLSIWRDRRTLLIGVIVLGLAFAEGSANDWLALAMVEGHGATKATGAIVLGVFVASMMVGRLAGVGLLDKFGRVPVLRGCAALASLGLMMVIFAPALWLAIAGVSLWGLGASLGFPVGMSAAAADPKTAAARVSAVATIGYSAFLVGPPLIGFLGHQVGLLRALVVVLVMVALAGAASGAARDRTEPTASG